MNLRGRLERLERSPRFRYGLPSPLVVLLYDIQPGTETFEEGLAGGGVEVRYVRDEPREPGPNPG